MTQIHVAIMIQYAYVVHDEVFHVVEWCKLRLIYFITDVVAINCYNQQYDDMTVIHTFKKRGNKLRFVCRYVPSNADFISQIKGHKLSKS